MKKSLILTAFIAAVVLQQGCYFDGLEYETNVLDPASGIDVIEIDSVVLFTVPPNSVYYYYFHLTPDTAHIDPEILGIRIFRNGEERREENFANNYFADEVGPSGESWCYEVELKAGADYFSKRSAPFCHTFP